MASPDSANITTGPGILRHAPLGTAVPTSRTGAYAAGWVQLGFTAEGHAQSHQIETEDIEVAELLLPVRKVTTKRTSTVSFALAELTLAHVKAAFNGGSETADGAIGSIYRPPAVGAEVRAMLAWDAEDGLERIVWRKVFQSGNIEIARRKGQDYAKIPCEFTVEDPGGGAAPFDWFFETARVAA